MSGWRFNVRHKFRLGPLFFWFTERGFQSWGVKFGRFTHNFSRGSTSVDTPGPGAIRHRRKRKKKAA